MLQTDNEKFLNDLASLIKTNIALKITLSKQRPGNRETEKALIRSIVINDETQYHTIYRQKTKDITKNYKKDQILPKIRELLQQNFYNAHLFTDAEEWQLVQNKKNNSKLTKVNSAGPIKIETTHDHQKSRWIDATSPYLHSLGLASVDGKIYDKAQDKYRQINKFIEIIDSLTKDWLDDKVYQIADMGSGKGYLTFALFDYLVNRRKLRCVITGYELRPELVETCYQVAIECGYMGLSFVQKSIEEIQLSAMDLVIALHACDTATDMAIFKGIQSNAHLIITSPCCHKQIRSAMTIKPEFQSILKHGILLERQAEILTDSIRSLLLESKGYKSSVFEFIDAEHTGKNLMITAQKQNVNTGALEEVQKIKTLFGILKHALEDMLYPQS
jgi:hypothetical protein